MFFSVVNSKMRKDASTLRNRGLKIENVELDKGFLVVSKIRKDSHCKDIAIIKKNLPLQKPLYEHYGGFVDSQVCSCITVSL